MTPLILRLAADLKSLDERDRRRHLRRSEPGSFASNDYLGLSNHPDLLQAVREALLSGVPIGSTGSRLLSGERIEHARAERAFASFVGRERALLFGSGFAANHALLSTLPGRRDLVLLDSAAHASLKEGVRTGLASKRVFRHNDVEHARSALRDRERFRDVFVIVEGVYSMEGDTAPLRDLSGLVQEFDAHLIVDEAHATGLFGEGLRGIHEFAGIDNPPLASIHPCGKAMGASGAFIAADEILIDYLINNARPFIFSTAPSPLLSIVLENVAHMLPRMNSTAIRVLKNSAVFREALTDLKQWRIPDGNTPIVPVVIGESSTAAAVAGRLYERGFDVRPVRPPTVPDGTARLRISVTAHHTPEDLALLAEQIIGMESETT